MTIMTCTFSFGLRASVTDLYPVLLFVVFYTVYNYFLDFNGFETLSQPYSKTTQSILMKFTQLIKQIIWSLHTNL